MARPAIPTELKKKHKREYMRIYRQRRKQQSFCEALQRHPATLAAEGTHSNSTMDTMKGES